jgi:hypothetical protein
VKRFYTAVAIRSEVQSEQAPIRKPFGLQFPDGTPYELNGLRHAPHGGETLCGIPNADFVFLGTAFAPEVPGACPVCMAEAERLDQLDDRPDGPIKP